MLDLGRPRLQGERRAVPHVDARRLRRGAHAGHDLHGRGREERGVRHDAPRAAHRLRRPIRLVGRGWPPVIAGLAVLTMTVANVIAGRQESVKRMLAYSSIAHAGYVLVGVVATIASKRPRSGRRDPLLSAHLHGLDGRRLRRAHPVRSQGAEATSYEDLAGVGRSASRCGARLLALLALARRRPADGRLLRQALRLPRCHLSAGAASTGSPSSAC